MKFFTTILLSLFCLNVCAQKSLPIIHARAKNARIYEEGNSPSGWGLDPKNALDTYTTNKFRHKKTVVFKTDIDSIRLVLKPGEKKDFIVLLNGKDSCLTRIQARTNKDYSKLRPKVNDSIPFFVNKFNTNLVNVIFNKTDTLTMNFDTGATEFSLLKTVLDTKVRSNPNLYDTFYDIKLGSRVYSSKVYDTQLVGNEADGLMGWDLFDGLIVELNYDKNLLIIHSTLPEKVNRRHGYAGLKIEYINDRPFIKSKIVQDGITNENWFLFDLGYQRTVMLDKDLLQKNHFPADKMKVIKKVMLRGTRNNEIPVITANLQKLQIGPFELRDVPAQLLGENKPMRGINIHILGNEVLKRLNTFLDFQKDVIYLAPNRTFNDDYIEQQKS